MIKYCSNRWGGISGKETTCGPVKRHTSQISGLHPLALRLYGFSPVLLWQAGFRDHLLPWDPHYHDEEIQAEIKGLGKRVAPLGKPFSRIWYSDGIWRPISP